MNVNVEGPPQQGFPVEGPPQQGFSIEGPPQQGFPVEGPPSTEPIEATVVPPQAWTTKSGLDVHSQATAGR